jgi:membrane protein YdbS with pleckstrin-like domain
MKEDVCLISCVYLFVTEEQTVWSSMVLGFVLSVSMMTVLTSIPDEVETAVWWEVSGLHHVSYTVKCLFPETHIILM